MWIRHLLAMFHGKYLMTNQHVVRPIPQAQIDAVSNKDEFKQNDGYQ
jgi:hypothetical protein